MIDGLGPYPTYKESGESWLGQIPVGWSIQRAKNLFRLRIQKSGDNHGHELLSVYTHIGVRPRKDLEERGNKATTTNDYWIVKRGDIIVNKLLAWMGAVGVSHYDGVTSPAYDILRPIVKLDTDYYHYLFRTSFYLQQFKLHSRGIMDMRLRLYFDELGQIPTMLPPIADQSAIVRFLDHADRRIRRYIRSKQKLLELLAEKRAVQTHEAISNAGTRWLRLGAVADRMHRSVNCLNEQVYKPIGLYNRGRGIFHKVPARGVDLGDSTFFWIADGDLVLSGQFAWEGAIAIAGQEDSGCVATHRYPILRGKPQVVETAYLLAFFRTSAGQFVLDENSRGAAGRNRPLNASTLMKEIIPIPPLIMQQRITALVCLEKQLVRVVAKVLERLREYRTRLIAEVVTGKLDVREAAARLPEEAKEQDTLDDTDMLAEGDEAIDDGDLDAVPEEAEV